MVARWLDTALIDFGGTLFPNDLPMTDELRRGRAEAISTVLAVEVEKAEQLFAEVEEQLRGERGRATDDVIVDVLADHHLKSSPELTRKVRQAMCIQLAGVLDPFEGAGALLRGIKELGWRSVIVSNTGYRDAELYLRDFEVLRWTSWIDGCITTVEAGCSKPDRRIFHAAIELAGSEAGRCVMIGDTEAADIEPAAALGMRSILVALEHPMPDATRADATAATLDEVLGVLRDWTSSEIPEPVIWDIPKDWRVRDGSAGR